MRVIQDRKTGKQREEEHHTPHSETHTILVMAPLTTLHHSQQTRHHTKRKREQNNVRRVDPSEDGDNTQPTTPAIQRDHHASGRGTPTFDGGR